MKLFNYDLKKRVASDVMKIEGVSGVSLILICSQIIHDSIKRSFFPITRWYYKRKYSEKKIIKLLDEQTIFEAARYILTLEGEKKNEYLIFLIDVSLGKKTDEDVLKFAEANKKKVEKMKTITQS